MSWAEHEAHMEEKKSTCKFLVRRPTRKRPLTKPRLTLEDNIKMHQNEIRWKCVDAINMGQDRG
jgi:hypothetical protein